MLFVLYPFIAITLRKIFFHFLLFISISTHTRINFFHALLPLAYIPFHFMCLVYHKFTACFENHIMQSLVTRKIKSRTNREIFWAEIFHVHIFCASCDAALCQPKHISHWTLIFHYWVGDWAKAVGIKIDGMDKNLILIEFSKDF